MKRALVSVALAGAAIVATNASAAVQTYDVSGVFDSGQTLTGSFSFDPAGKATTQFSNVAVTVTGFDVFNLLLGEGYLPVSPGPFQIGLQNDSGDQLNIGFDATHTTDVLDAVVSPILNPIQTYYRHNGAESELLAGQINQSSAPAVPEPASWVMMILGMGAVGYMLRTAKRRSDEKFDAKIKRITYKVA